MARSSATRHGKGGVGGPAKGAGNGRPPAPQFAPGNPGYTDAGGGPNGGHGSKPTPKTLERAERIRRHHENLDAIAFNPEMLASARVAASVHALDRLEGKPVQPTINANVDDVSRLSDADIRDELARLLRAGVAAGEGTDEPGVQG